MPTEVILPQLGESVAEGVITRWLKQVGDTVDAEEPLVEISTDKVNVELPAPAAGIVQELRAQEGETVPVEQVIAVIGDAVGVTTAAPTVATVDAAVSAGQPGPAPATSTEDEIPGHAESLDTDETVGSARPAQQASAQHDHGFGSEEPAGANGNRRHFSPLVRRIATENHLDLERLTQTGQLVGTGESGRVTKSDLMAFLSRAHTVAPPAEPAPVQRPAAPRPAAPPPAPPLPAAAGVQESDDEIVVPFTGMRRMIADHLTRSAFTAPHVTTVAQADVTRMVAFRAANKETWEKEYGVKLTYTPFFVKAAAEALLAFPMVNSTIQGDNIIAKKRVHMGVAVSLGEGGLIVPVIRDADRKDLLTVATELQGLASKARSGKLLPNDVQGGTFSITNPGVFGAIISTPIINAPQSAILGVEAIQRVPVVREDDSIAIRSVMYLCLSYDHRVVDGETAIRFLQHIRQTLEGFKFFR